MCGWYLTCRLVVQYMTHMSFNSFPLVQINCIGLVWASKCTCWWQSFMDINSPLWLFVTLWCLWLVRIQFCWFYKPSTIELHSVRAEQQSFAALCRPEQWKAFRFHRKTKSNRLLFRCIKFPTSWQYYPPNSWVYSGCESSTFPIGQHPYKEKWCIEFQNIWLSRWEEADKVKTLYFTKEVNVKKAKGTNT